MGQGGLLKNSDMESTGENWGATQRIEGSAEDVRFFQRWRRELVGFLERAVKVGEPLCCDVAAGRKYQAGER
jgi:hypothetical protein